MKIIKRKRQGRKKNRREKAIFRRRIKRERHRAAKIKAKRENHRRKHPKKETRYGIFTIIARYMIDHLKIRELLQKNFTLRKGKNSKFNAADMIAGILLAIILGAERLYHISTKYKEEKVLAEQMGMPAMFSGDTAYRFVNKFGVPLANWQIQEISASLIRNQLRKGEIIIADLDWTTLRSYENKKEGAECGYNKLRPGQACFQASQFFVNGYGICPELLGGKTMPKTAEFLDKNLSRVRYLVGHIDWFRGDSAYCSTKNLRVLDEFTCTVRGTKKIQFIVGSSISSQGAKNAFEMSEKRRWQKINDGTFIMDFPSIQVYAGYPICHRMIIVRRFFKARDRWDDYAIVTSNTEMSAKQTFYFYHQRETIENFFKEAKHSYYLENLPASKLGRNQLYLHLICLAFNIIRMARMTLLSHKDHNIYLATLRRNYLHLDVTFRDGILFIPRWMPQYRAILAILQRLIDLNVPYKYRLTS